MINFKSNFQQFLTLTAVWISFACAQVDPDGFKKCKTEMMKTFGSLDISPIDCVKFAIKSLKSHSHYKMDNDVKEYYDKFDSAVTTGKILLPHFYCFDLLKKKNLEINQKNLEYDRCAKELKDFGVSSRDMKKYQESVLLWALYNHRQMNVGEEIKEGEKHCHEPGSYGFQYLDYISGVVEFIPGSLKKPIGFCEEKYNNSNSPSTSALRNLTL